MTQANMKGRKVDTGNILSDGHSISKDKDDGGAQKLTFKISSRNSSPRTAIDIEPKKAPDKRDNTEMQIRTPSRNGKCSTTNPINGSVTRASTRNGSSAGNRQSVSIEENVKEVPKNGDEVPNSSISGKNGVHNNGEQVSPRTNGIRNSNNGDHVSPRARDNGVQNNAEQVSLRTSTIHNNGGHISPRGDEVHNKNVSPGKIGSVCPRSSNTPDSERERSSPSCSSGGRKSSHDPQGSDRDHTFMNRFETKEQPWKPGKKVIDHSSDQPPSEYRWKSSRKSIPAADRMQSRTPEWRSEDPPVSRKGPGSRDGGAAKLQREYDPYGNPLNAPEWEWHPGKGRGNGPAPGEWLPPFRGYSARAESEPPPFLKGKASGRRHSDEWLHPFLVVDRPASWHRSKGTGSGPPPDQWSPPWRHESATDGERLDDATSVRSGRKHFPTSCLLK